MPDEPQGQHTDYSGGVSTYSMTKAIQDCLPELVRLNQEMEGHARETTAATKQATRATRTMKWLTGLVTIATALNLIAAGIANWPAIKGRLPMLGDAAIDRKKLEGLHRAGKAVEAALTVGVTYPKFVELLQSFWTEFLIAEDNATTESEKELARLYGTALTDYQDSAKFWNAKNVSNAQYKLLTDGGKWIVLDVGDVADAETFASVEPLLVKYGILNETRSRERKIPSSVIDKAWKVGAENLAKADRKYRDGG